MAAEEHRVPTVSRLELGGSPRGRGRGERKEWGESFRPHLLKGAHLVGTSKTTFFWEGTHPGFVKNSSSQEVQWMEVWKSLCREPAERV